jgi:hypothetical protein
MGASYKPINNSDIISTKTLLHEAIPITGSILSGTYGMESGVEFNIKNYSHGMFQSVYDYPYLSSSSNHLLDISIGYSGSAFSASANTQNAKKVNLYNQMSQVLMGFDENGLVRPFDRDGNLTGGEKMQACYFVSFSRLLVKDEIKKGTFTIKFHTASLYTNTQGWPDPIQGHANFKTIADHGAQNSFFVNSPAGEYGILYTSSANITQGTGVGLIFYQAGIAVLSASIFGTQGTQATPNTSMTAIGVNPHNEVVSKVMTGSNIQTNCDHFRHRFYNVSFNNTVELNSTIYYCRASHNEFNYSSNPTYISGSKIITKNIGADLPVSYITTVGMYSADNELLAVAKLSEPLKKDPTTELTLRVRLDY